MLEHRCKKCDKLLATSLSDSEKEDIGCRENWFIKKEKLTIKCPRCKDYNDLIE